MAWQRQSPKTHHVTGIEAEQRATMGVHVGAGTETITSKRELRSLQARLDAAIARRDLLTVYALAACARARGLHR